MAIRWKSRRKNISCRSESQSSQSKAQTLPSFRIAGWFNVCQQAVKELAKKGIKAELIDLRTISPLDIATVAASVRKTHRCVLVEEGHIFGDIAAEVGFQIMEHCFDYLDAPIERVCQRETPMPYSKVLERETVPTVSRILSCQQNPQSVEPGDAAHAFYSDYA